MKKAKKEISGEFWTVFRSKTRTPEVGLSVGLLGGDAADSHRVYFPPAEARAVAKAMLEMADQIDKAT